MNVLLKALIAEADMSHAGLAKRVNDAAAQEGVVLNYDHTSVARWITKGQRPRGRGPDLICAVLGQRLGRLVSFRDIGMDTATPAEADDEPATAFLDRAAALWSAAHFDTSPNNRIVTGSAAITPVWNWENLSAPTTAARTGTITVGAPELAALQAARTRYEQMYRRVGGIATGPRITEFLRLHAAPLLRGSYSDPIGRELFRIAGGLAALTGICSYDAGDHRGAQTAFHQALRFAQASGDRNFGAYVLALLVNQNLALGQHRYAIAFADAALRGAAGSLPAALVTDLAVMQAKAYAAMNSVGDTHRAMALAERAAADLGSPDDFPEASYVQAGMVLAKLAEAHLALGNLRLATETAEQAIAEPGHIRCRVNRLATLALIDIHTRNTERTADTIATMVDHAQGMESIRLRGRFTDLHHRLTTTGDRASREALPHLDLWLAVP